MRDYEMRIVCRDIAARYGLSTEEMNETYQASVDEEEIIHNYYFGEEKEVINA
jgi:hypothetical protein